MTVYERGLSSISDTPVIAVVCTFLILYAATPSSGNSVERSTPIQFLCVSAIAALAAAKKPVISVVLLMAFYCLINNNPVKI